MNCLNEKNELETKEIKKNLLLLEQCVNAMNLEYPFSVNEKGIYSGIFRSDDPRIKKIAPIASFLYKYISLDADLCLPVKKVIDRFKKSECLPTSSVFWEDISIIPDLYFALHQTGYYDDGNEYVSSVK